jgi:hypothetical protein
MKPLTRELGLAKCRLEVICRNCSCSIGDWSSIVTMEAGLGAEVLRGYKDSGVKRSQTVRQGPRGAPILS